MNFTSLHTKIALAFVGLAASLLTLFAYIAYIDMELILRTYVTKDMVDESIYLPTLSDAENIDRTLSTILRWFAIDLAVGFALLIGASIWVARSVTKPLENCVKHAQRISEGDLSQAISHDRKDEIGHLMDSLNEMTKSLSQLVNDVHSSADEVSQESKSITAMNQQASESMSTQHAHINEVSQSIEQMSDSFSEVARNTSDAASRASESGQIAQAGGGAVKDTIAGIDSIHGAVNVGVESVLRLGERGKEIGEIVHIIKEVADQTNLLALNAAIEAARAGESGRGFAVVADEVRGLANKTASAADEISRSISESQSDTEMSIEHMQRGAELVNAGADHAAQAGSSLNQVVDSADEVIQMVQSIATATEQQSQVATTIVTNIDSIRQGAQETSDGCQQALRAAHNLEDKAARLHQSVQRFKL